MGGGGRGKGEELVLTLVLDEDIAVLEDSAPTVSKAQAAELCRDGTFKIGYFCVAETLLLLFTLGSGVGEQRRQKNVVGVC
ncbi:hypothetical protein HDU76_001843, partial [Blyttiomyces sp. JEL0837]